MRGRQGTETPGPTGPDSIVKGGEEERGGPVRSTFVSQTNSGTPRALRHSSGSVVRSGPSFSQTDRDPHPP